MRLPSELLDHIFGLLAGDLEGGPDVETLKVCNLVSSTIAAICEPHLYGTVYLTCIARESRSDVKEGTTVWCQQADPYDPQCWITVTRFKDTLCRKPHIGRYVRRLGILSLDIHTKRWFNKPKEWWEIVGVILNGLERDRIEWFKLYSNARVGLNEMSATTRDAVLDVLKSPVLHSLHVYRIADIPIMELAGYLGGLRHLDAVGCDLDQVRDTTVVSSNTTISLESLVLRLGIHEMVGELTALRNKDGRPVLDLGSLSCLRLGRMNTATQELAWSILKRAKNLKKLSLSNCPAYSIDFRIGGPSFCTALAAVKDTLQTLTIVWKPEAYAVFHEVATFLLFDTSGGSPKFAFSSLTHLQLTVHAPQDYGETHSMKGWGRTADVLCDNQRFPCLKTVGLYIGSKWPLEARLASINHYLDTALLELMPRLKDRGIELLFLHEWEWEI